MHRRWRWDASRRDFSPPLSHTQRICEKKKRKRKRWKIGSGSFRDAYSTLQINNRSIVYSENTRPSAAIISCGIVCSFRRTRSATSTADIIFNVDAQRKQRRRGTPSTIFRVNIADISATDVPILRIHRAHKPAHLFREPYILLELCENDFGNAPVCRRMRGDNMYGATNFSQRDFGQDSFCFPTGNFSESPSRWLARSLAPSRALLTFSLAVIQKFRTCH